MELSQQQQQFFNTFGFLRFPGLLSDRIGSITDDFEAVFRERGGGHNGAAHDGTARSCIVPFIDQSANLSALLDDERVRGIASGLLGADFNYMGSDGNFYVGDTSWHSDGWHPVIRHLKIALYLDPVTRDTGALRVIPGSHLLGDSFADGCQREIWKSQCNWGAEGHEVPSVALESTPGDVVCFNHNLKHAAFGGNNRRRMFTINLCQRHPEELLPELRNYIGQAARFWLDRYYGEAMMKTSGPERRKHLEQILDNEGHLPELSRQARLKMKEPARG